MISLWRASARPLAVRYVLLTRSCRLCSVSGGTNLLHTIASAPCTSIRVWAELLHTHVLYSKSQGARLQNGSTTNAAPTPGKSRQCQRERLNKPSKQPRAPANAVLFTSSLVKCLRDSGSPVHHVVYAVEQHRGRQDDARCGRLGIFNVHVSTLDR